MSIIRGGIILGAALLLGGAAGAEAADLYGGGLKGGYVAPMVAPSPRVYFRIDGGYGFHHDPDIAESGYEMTGTSIDDTWTLGGGIGAHLTRSLRTDVTLDHRFETDIEGSLADPATTLTGTRRFGLSSTVALLNLYYDFETSSRFTPYVGLGLGAVYHSTKSGTVDNGCVLSGGCTGTIEGDSNWDFAAALMAGFTMSLSGHREHFAGSTKDGGPYAAPAGRDILLDVGYRYLYLGETQTGTVALSCGGVPCAEPVTADPSVDTIHAHEFRVGLRYNMR